MIELRPYQAESIEALRKAIREGHKRIILCAPTGSGKTEVGMALIQEAIKKGSKTAFITDRLSILDQTSARFDANQIPHGIIQAGHWRWRPYEAAQVASAQTLARRGVVDGLKFIIVDECHTKFSTTVKFLQENPEIVTVGLTATPFTKGLGEIYSRIVNITTTNELIDQGWLIRPRVFAAKPIDIQGVKLSSTGEWDAEELAAKGRAIIGDVVSGWVEKTQAIFGGPVKSIVFSPNVDYGEDLCARWKEAGFNFINVSYKDGNDDARRKIIEEFRKPDSEIMGLVSCYALAKGFDVPDIQCIAEGSLVLCQRGLVPIEEITLCDRIWDGIEFVSHGGAVYRGEKDVIQYAGLEATPDHLVKTEKAWTRFGDCATQQIPIRTTAFGWNRAREGEDYFTSGGVAWRKATSPSLHIHGVYWLRKEIIDRVGLVLWSLLEGVCRLSKICSRNDQPNNSSHKSNEISLPRSIAQTLQELRTARDKVLLRFSTFCSQMDFGEPGVAKRLVYAIRPYRQRRKLSAREPAVGNKASEWMQNDSRWMGSKDAQIPPRTSRDPVRRQDATKFVFGRSERPASNREILQGIRQTKRRVWDILDCGPRNRFTCQGLLVHNCGVDAHPFRKSLSSVIQQIGRVMRPAPGKSEALWLDHAGNYERFYDDITTFFSEGLKGLKQDHLDSTARKEKQEEEKKEIRCQKCNCILMPGQTVCPSCGHERKIRRQVVDEVAGELVELSNGVKVERWLADKEAIASQIWYYALSRKGGDKEAARKFGNAQYRNLYGMWPKYRIDSYEPRLPDSRLVSKIKANLIRYAYRRKAEEAKA